MSQDLLQLPSGQGAASPNGGSEPPAADELTCGVCGRACKTKVGLASHLRGHERAGPPDPAEAPVKKAAPLSRPNLREVQAELAGNIKTVGELLHPLLVNLKLARLQNPEARIRIPRTRVDVALPEFDTHLAWTVISRSELTARILVEHAAENETLLRWLVRFNGWFKGGETGSLIGAHVSAAAGSLGVSNGVLSTIQGALIPDVLEQVRTENFELRRQVEQLQAQMAAAAARGDERGAGN